MTMLNWPVYYCCPLQQVCVKFNDDFNTPHLHISSLCKLVLTQLCASSVKTKDCYIYTYWIDCFYYRTTDRASNHWRSSFSVAAAKTWNSLPQEVTSPRSTSFSSFKSKLKTYLFSPSFFDLLTVK